MRRLEYSEIEFTAPFSLEECRIRLMNRPHRITEDELTGFDPWVDRESASTLSFEILRMRRFQKHGHLTHFIEMYGSLRAINDHETQVLAGTANRRYYTFLLIYAIVFALIWVNFTQRLPFFMLFGLALIAALILSPLADHRALKKLLRDTLGSSAFQPQKLPAPSLPRHWRLPRLQVGPRTRFVVSLPLERCRWQLINRDYSALKQGHSAIEKPVFERVDDRHERFTLRSLHGRRALFADESVYFASDNQLQGDLVMINDHETQVDLVLRISFSYYIMLIPVGFFALISVLFIYWALTAQVPGEFLLMAAFWLYIGVGHALSPRAEHDLLVHHVQSSLDPKRFISLEERFGL